jgi:hypothetical protein
VDLITRYIASCSSFRAKSTVYGTLSTMRCFGDYLVREGLWCVFHVMPGQDFTPCRATVSRMSGQRSDRCRPGDAVPGLPPIFLTRAPGAMI